MNFQHINDTLGTPVHVWGASAYKDAAGIVHGVFMPVKRLIELADVAVEVRVVAQSSNGEDLYLEWFRSNDLFRLI